jgi:quinol monooxygenase YgiN
MRSEIAIVLVLFGIVASNATSPAQDKEHPIEKEVKESLKDTTKPFTLIVRLKIKDGGTAKFEAAFAKARTATRKEKGNLAYDMGRSAKSPNEYLIYERWQDLAALQTHLRLPHFAALIAEVHELLDGPPDAKVFVPAGE